VFLAFVLVALATVGGVIAFVAITLRGDARAADARDARTEEWLADLNRRYEVEDGAHERAAEAMLAARHRSGTPRADRPRSERRRYRQAS
jgi:hypothetical protein